MSVPGRWPEGSRYQTKSLNELALSLAPVLTDASNLWWSELKENGVNPNLKFTMEEFSRGIGHWSQVCLADLMRMVMRVQMAWAKTTRIGCGVGHCDIGTLVVCNYAPS